MILNDIEKKFIDNPQCAFYFCVQKSKKGTRGLLMRLEGCKKEGSITTLYLQGFQYTLVQDFQHNFVVVNCNSIVPDIIFYLTLEMNE